MVGLEKSSINRAQLVIFIRSETGWANHEQAIIGWTNVCCKIFGWFVIRGERLIKLGDSWFSAKSIEVEF